MAPTRERRSSSACVYLVSCLFFFTTLAGGAFLLLYITLPEAPATSWLPIAGIVLVGIPWLFWITTCVYRAFTGRESAADDDVPVATVVVSTTPVATTASVGGGGEEGCCSPLDSPGGASRRVRFGAATVMGGQEGNGNGGVAGTSGKNDGAGDLSASVSNDGSSLTSHESEVPLALSMS